MKILIIDERNERDLAQYDMYGLISKDHTLYFSSMSEWELYISDVDLIWLGIYHQEFKIDWKPFASLCNVPVMIDNADNEEFVEKSAKIPYRLFKHKIFTSRYLPHKQMSKMGQIYNVPVMQLSWYINPDRFDPAEKDIDIVFIASINDARYKLIKDIQQICEDNDWTYFMGEEFKDYASYLSHAKIVYCECSRKCLTQKYIEAILSGCVIIGDKPIYPDNNIKVIPADDIAAAIRKGLKSKPQTHTSTFLSDFNNILHELSLV